MYKAYYEFCGVPVELTAPLPISENGQGEQFRREQAVPLLQIGLDRREELPDPIGRLCGSAGDRCTYRTDHIIQRITKDRFRPAPHISVFCDLDDPSAVKAFVRQEDWEWASGTRYLWSGLCLNQLLLPFRTLFFHASYVAWQGRGLLFTAPSGTGKSTQAELWRKYRGAEVINGDKAAVSLRGAPVIHSVPFSGTSGLCRDLSLPLAAVVVLSQSPENRLERMPPSRAVAAVCPNVFAEQTVPEEWGRVLNLLLDLTASVPVYSLACTPDRRAVETLEPVLNGEYTGQSG